MATLPTTKRISIEDVRGAEPWFTRFLDPLNTFFGAVYDALNGNLTFVENVSAQIRDIEFTTLSNYSSGYWSELIFANSLRKKAIGVLILNITQVEDNYTPIVQAVSLDWTELNGNIILGFVSGLADSTTYNLKVMVI